MNALKEKLGKIREYSLEFYKYLYDVWNTSSYKEAGFNTFKQYVEESLDIPYKEVKYIVFAVKRAKELGLLNKLTPQEWHRFCVIASVITIDNQKEWLEKMVGLSISELKKEVSVYKKNKKAKSNKKIRFICQLTKEQEDVILTAIETAKKKWKIDTTGDVLFNICYEWLQGE